ncbi:DUF6221 family protein [Micromonospora sp. NPDC049081]|uniref:DUF6221 family protein n=1 Tax=Micromonospora sp. NPDC049081 TaxID=3155150 RepID=UPI0033CAF28F
MVYDLMNWLTAQFDASERWAQEASRHGDRYTPTGEHWRWECEDTDTAVTVDPMLSEYVEGVDGAPVGLRSVEGYPSTWGATLHHIAIRGQEELPAGVAGHIARQDPARTIRAVAAKRRIFERHGPILNDLNPYPVCMCCPNLDDDTNTEGERWPCLTVRLLTVEYDDQPGYRPEWGPQ